MPLLVQVIVLCWFRNVFVSFLLIRDWGCWCYIMNEIVDILLNSEYHRPVCIYQPETKQQKHQLSHHIIKRNKQEEAPRMREKRKRRTQEQTSSNPKRKKDKQKITNQSVYTYIKHPLCGKSIAGSSFSLAGRLAGVKTHQHHQAGKTRCPHLLPKIKNTNIMISQVYWFASSIRHRSSQSLAQNRQW